MIGTYQFSFAAVGLILLTTVALASESDVRNACMNDAKKFCGSAVDQAEARRACMTKYKSRLSRGCKVAIRKDVLQHAGPKPR